MTGFDVKDAFNNVGAKGIQALNHALADAQIQAINREFTRTLKLLKPTNPYVALTYDALRLLIPDAKLQAAVQKSWPTPNQVGL